MLVSRRRLSPRLLAAGRRAVPRWMVGVASRAAVGQAACQHAMLVRENGQWDATLSVHRAPRSPRSHSHWLRDAAQITTTPGCHSRAQHRPAARRTAGAAAGEAEESLVVRSPRPKTGWWGRAVRLVNRHRRLSLRPRRACTSRRRGNTRNRARGVPVGHTLRRRPCHGCVFRAEAHRADIGRVPGDAPCGGGSSVREQARARQRRRLRARSPSPASASVPTPSTS